MNAGRAHWSTNTTSICAVCGYDEATHAIGDAQPRGVCGDFRPRGEAPCDEHCPLVQEAIPNLAYTTALRWVREHQAAFPEPMPKEIRALGIIDCKDVE